MSTKKKRIVVPKPTIKETKMPIDPALFNPSSPYRYRTDLDRELAEDELMDARDLKQLRVQEIKAKRKARIRDFEMQRGGNPGSMSNREREALAKSLITDPRVQEMWLALDNASRTILLTSANTLNQQGQSANSLANFMPFMLMQMKQNPQTSAKELVELINVIRPVQTGGKNETADLIRALTPLIQQQQGSKGGVSEVITALAPFLSQMAAKDQALLLERLRNMESRIVDPIDILKSIGANAELLGYKKGAPNLEIEKLRSDTQFKLQHLAFEHQKWRDDADLRKMSEQGRMTMLGQLVNKGIDTASPLLNKLAGGVKSKPGNPPRVKTVTTLSCVDCGTPIPFIGEPEAVTCPKCKLVHKKNIIDEPNTPPPKVQAGHGTFTMEK